MYILKSALKQNRAKGKHVKWDPLVLCYSTCSCSHASGRDFEWWDILFWSNLYRNKVPSASCTTAPEQSDVNTIDTRTPPAGISFLKYRVY
jgi:hypothetical protein